MKSIHATTFARRARLGTHFAGLFAALLLFAGMPAVANDYDYAYLSQFGGPGAGSGQFGEINYVAVDSGNHHILVGDGGNSLIQIFTAEGLFLSQFGGPGMGNGQFNGVGGIAVEPGSHDIVVADGNGRIQIFDQNGTYVRQFGSPGEGNGQFQLPYGVAIDPVTRNIVVVDNGNSRVQIYAWNGAYLDQFGAGLFKYPAYLAIDPATHDILVADEVISNVQVFSANGAYLRQFGGPGNGNGEFGVPGACAITIDPTTHNIAVVDYANNRIEVFDSNGGYLSQFGSQGSDNGQFNGPTGMGLDTSTHNLVVADRSDTRMEIFALASGAPPPPACGPTQVSLGVYSNIVTSDEDVLFSANASITAPFAGTVSFVIDDTATACTASMSDVSASCSHPLLLGTHSVVAKYSGDGHNQPGCSSAQTVQVLSPGGQLPTAVHCDPLDPVMQGESAALTCRIVGPADQSAGKGEATTGDSAPSGFLTFAQGDNVRAYVPAFASTAIYSTVFGGGDYPLTVTYSGDAQNSTSTVDVTVSVTTPADDIFYGGFDLPPG